MSAAARGALLADEDLAALKWLEGLDAPVIAAPRSRRGRAVFYYVPNNDLDAKGGNPASVAEIRVAKVSKPHFFDHSIPFCYQWRFPGNSHSEQSAVVISRMADKLYQFGRGVDMAWAWGEVVPARQADSWLTEYPGIVYRPGSLGGEAGLLCPQAGSLTSLAERYDATRHRFTKVADRGKQQLAFSQAPKPKFNSRPYENPPVRALYDLSVAWPCSHIVKLTERIRETAAQRLLEGLPGKHDEIERLVLGRNATEADKSARIRVVPLPSIGHSHADRSVRRVLLEIPQQCSLRPDDIQWAFSGLVVDVDPESGEVTNSLVAASDSRMLRHYCVGYGLTAREWRSVTAVALPIAVARRRIDPARLHLESKGGVERMSETTRAAGAVLQALRHLGMRAIVTTMRLQREPFEDKGSRAEAFAEGTRFAKERLWHVEIVFTEAVTGPLVIGDGRYLGLGLMAPVRAAVGQDGIYSFRIADGLLPQASPIECSRALRRAIMALVQDQLGASVTLPTFFTGHEADGSPARGGSHTHLAFVADLERCRLLVISPHSLEHRLPTRTERVYLRTLSAAAEQLTQLRAGRAGLLTLSAMQAGRADPILAMARAWQSVTDYHVTRHAKRVSLEDAFVDDIRTEIHRLGLPTPTRVDVLELSNGVRGGISGRARIQFNVVVRGPILIGRTRHVGGGLFAGVDGRQDGDGIGH
jgi:CRISPR-associated protein Csb2